jgi:hypothetical protein
MKKSFLILTAAFSIYGVLASAQTKPTTFASNAYKTTNDKICVYIDKNTRTTSSVSIYDSKGMLITRSFVPKHIMKSGYKYDVSQLSAGDYSIVVRNKNEEEVHNLTIVAPQVVTKRLVTVR